MTPVTKQEYLDSLPELRERLRSFWSRHDYMWHPGWGRPFLPVGRILDEFGEVSLDDMDHLKLIRWYPAVVSDSPRGERIEVFDFAPLHMQQGLRLVKRRLLSRTYGWGMPLDSSLCWLRDRLQGTPVIEVGAGAGYWSSLLKARSVDVIATDLQQIKSNGFTIGSGFTHVRQQDAVQAASENSDRALMLVWPPPASSMADSSLEAYEGDLLVYVGDPLGGMCADPGFFSQLSRNWRLTSVCPLHLRWLGYQDEIQIYQRR